MVKSSETLEYTMKRSVVLALLTAGMSVAALGSAAPALAHPILPVEPALPFDPGQRSTDNIEYLARYPQHTGTAGGQPSADGKRFFVTDPRGVYVYDTTNPKAPALLGSIVIAQTSTGVALAQEDPDTNEKILLVDGASTASLGSTALHIVDVSNPAALRVLDTVPVTDHTWTCVTGTDDTGATNSCAYAYGRSGHIIDLTNPAEATKLPTSWRKPVGYGDIGNPSAMYTHDLTEIRPGLVMSAGSTVILMDTTNPEAPIKLTAIEQPGRFTSLGYHSAEWAQGGTDPYLILGTEIAPSGPTNTAGSDCIGPNSVIETWDARGVIAELATRSPGTTTPLKAVFTLTDQYDAGKRGIFIEGQSPSHLLYCAHWMEQSPAYGTGTGGSNFLAVSYYDRGTRFVKVDDLGVMSEVGWVVAADSYSGSPQWVTNEVVYIFDYRRGMEVIRFTGAEAGGVIEPAPGPVVPEGPLVALFPVVALVVVGVATAYRRRSMNGLAAA